MPTLTVIRLLQGLCVAQALVTFNSMIADIVDEHELRTGKRQEGITFILVDMNTPGLEVKPLITIEGTREVNEVFFTDVRVPAANRSSSNMPIGPFQNTIRASMITSEKAAAVPR